MDPEHQTFLIGVIVLLLIINTTAIFSIASDKGLISGGQPAASVTAKPANASPAVTQALNKTLASPTVTSKANATPSSVPKPGDTSKAVPAKTSNASVKTTPAPTKSSTAGYLKYTNDSYQFTISYPSDWTVAEMNTTLLKTINASRSKKEPGITVVELYSPSIIRCDELNKDDCVQVRSEVRVDVDRFSNASQTFEDYYLKDVVRLMNEYPIQITRKDAQVSVSGRKAYSFEYHTGESQGTDGTSVIKIYAANGDRVFIITCHSHDAKTGETDQFVKYSGVFQSIIKSFTYSRNMEVL
jgi:hypothetical protein